MTSRTQVPFASLRMTSENEKPRTSRLSLLLFFEAFDEFEGVDGFRNQFEFEALALAFEEDLGDSRLAGEEQDFCRGILPSDCDCELDTVHAGHENVTEQEIG